MSFYDILTQPIIQEIVQHFDPKTWARWNKISSKANRLSKPFLPYLMEIWSKKCPDKLPTDDLTVKLHSYSDAGDLKVYNCPYILTKQNTKVFMGTGFDRCGCTRNGKVGMRYSKPHGTVHLRHTHSNTEMEYHGHYNNGIPLVTFSVIKNKEGYAQSRGSDISVDSTTMTIPENIYNGLDCSQTDQKHCPVCDILDPQFRS